jgi:ATPase subunit of ABC transporter with duplicated ATPase domains
VVDELRRWREDTSPAPAPPSTPTAPQPFNSFEPTSTAVAHLTGLLEPLATAVQELAQRIEAQDKAHAEQTALAYDRFTAVQKMAMVAIDEAREQTRFWKQEAERAKLESAAQVDTYRDAMRSAQGEARRLAELLEIHQAAASTLQPSQLRIPPSPTLAGIGSAPVAATAPVIREPALPRQYDPDGHAEE